MIRSTKHSDFSKEPSRKRRKHSSAKTASKKKPLQMPASQNSRVTPARRLAWEMVQYAQKRACYISEAFEAISLPPEFPSEEKAFARLLATEVVSYQGALDELIDRVLRNPDDVNADVRNALRVSFYELFYLDKASHAVVDQGVELVRSIAPKATGVANFALRRAVEQRPEFPFGSIEDNDKAAALYYGFPFWLARRLIAEQGREAALRFMRQSNDPAPLFFMINTINTDGARTLERLVQAGLKVLPCAPLVQTGAMFPLFVFAQRNAVAHPLVLQLLADGILVVSDQAAISIAGLALPLRPPQSFLEIGAGRGTKTILLQNAAVARFGYQIPIDTLDMSAARTREREKRLKRARVRQDNVFIQDATDLSMLKEESYDAIFIDAPCTGVGTLRRHPDIRWRVTPEDVSSFAHIGERILKQAARLVKQGGQLVYATCTVFTEENESVIQRFLESPEGSSFSVFVLRENGGDSLASRDGDRNDGTDQGAHAVTDDTLCCGAGQYGALFPGVFMDREQMPPSDSHFVCVLHRR